ncbi:hypothetical protein H257_00478 [Aphanomyces astaci]|uniref:BTB domain-containing protein n=2 Tax=Aphanomyces astaci TaxID=112090 RepID=W4HC10_APHAT|nr:hypothetical protein H257_00478 [Aphanomyces astaci]ETV89101.1 hypothetical protein H257_00478 [Aphanomyces astaci]|eukprot:XP_009821501.1 hypothetical protein H257_00478 [Aphanomyces astaci]
MEMQMTDKVEMDIPESVGIVMLDVGGTMFKTSKSMLLRMEGSYFHALLGSGLWKPDSAGDAYFLDLDPHLFRHVLTFLQTGEVSTSGFSDIECAEFEAMLEYLKLIVPKFQWDLTARAQYFTLSNYFRTIERKAAQNGKWTSVVVKQALVEGDFRIRVDSSHENHHFIIGLAPKRDASRITCCVSFYPSGEVYKQALVGTLRPIRAGDVLTIRRGPSHVEFIVNDGPRQNVELEDPSEELFPRLHTWRQGTKMTILGE